MTIPVITCRGLFEPNRPGNMLSNLTNRLDRDRFHPTEFPVWGAGFGDYDRELDRVSAALAQHIRDHQGPLVGAGFSGGSHVWKRAMLRLSGDDRAKLLRLVLCADPSMPYALVNRERMWGTRRFSAGGIAGGEPLWLTGGVDYVVDQGDPICQTPIGSPLRTLAAFLTSMGPDAGMPARMRVKLAAAAVGRRYDLGAYAEAVSLFRAYAGRPSAHVVPYPALLARVADDINRTVRG